MDDVATCSLSVDDVKSLTIPKLKAELTRLNQPIGGLKLKAQFVDALIVSFALGDTGSSSAVKHIPKGGEDRDVD